MLKIRRTKWMAGLLSLALMCGVAVTTTACGGEDREITQDEEDKKEKRESDGKADAESGKDKSENAGNGAEESSEEEGQGYRKLAARIEDGVVSYFEAMKAGDIETILSMTDPESKMYEKLAGIKDYETGREFIHALYANIKYELPEEGETERKIESVLEMGNDEFALSMNIGLPCNDIFPKFLTVPGVVFQDGELIPDGYEVKSNEEALEMVRSATKMVPLQYYSSIEVKLREDGGFYFAVSDFFWDYYGSDIESGENFLQEYLTQVIHDGIIVGETEGSFEGNQEEWTQLLSLMKQKDFDGLLALANSNPEWYSYMGDPYPTPEELTEAQRAFYDSYVERIEYYVREETDAVSKKHDFEVIIIAPALYWYDPVMEWYTENGIMELDMVEAWDGFGSDSDAALAGTIGVLLSPLRRGIEYAESNIYE